jgi:hypothetical protein
MVKKTELTCKIGKTSKWQNFALNQIHITNDVTGIIAVHIYQSINLCKFLQDDVLGDHYVLFG